MMPAIVGLMPLLERRLNILIRSGTAAKVVPNPATNPNTSDFSSPGKNRLEVSGMPRLSQPLRTIALSTVAPAISILRQATVVMRGLSLHCISHPPTPDENSAGGVFQVSGEL